MRDSSAFQDLDAKYHLTDTLKEQTTRIPSLLGNAASELQGISFGVLKNLISAITIVVIAFFLLLEGPAMLDRFLTWLGGERERRGRRISRGHLLGRQGLRDDQPEPRRRRRPVHLGRPRAPSAWTWRSRSRS